MKLKYFSIEGDFLEEKDLPIPEFDGDRGLAALRNVALAYQNNFRQGDAHCKNRGEVSGSGKKPYRQKGTGMARHGEKRSPIWSGGGVVFGPRSRDYSVKINKKEKRIALARNIFDRAKNGEIILVEGFHAEKPRTKFFSDFLRKICIDSSQSALLIDVGFEENAILSLRNLPNVCMMDARSLNAWQSFYCKSILMTLSASAVLLERIGQRSQ
ncbi:MAG: 50S ribosomal protein L4 [Puniceicoccales bacterium]|jgi:large subunit ribosomal protein L4|nr:50S ribosomal protein L4 [Puniceicoccales bacterium]